MFTASVPCDARFLKAIRAFFHSVLCEFAEDQADMLILALDESCSNLLKHARCEPPAQVVRVRAELSDDRVRFERAPFDHPSISVPNGHPGDENGVTEARNPDGVDFGTEKLQDLVGRSSATAERVGAEIMKEVLHFAAGRAPHDDTTLVCFSRESRGKGGT